MIAFKKNMACIILALGASSCFAGKTRLMKPDVYKGSVLKAGFTQRSRPPEVKTCTLKKCYIDAIWDGRKTVEGRLNKDFFKRLNVKKGDHIWFHTQSPYGVLCAVTDVKAYSSFKEMLEASSFKTCVPEAKTFDQAVRAYHKFYSQKEEAEFGVIAWHVHPIGIEKPKSVSTKYLSRVHTKRLQNHRRPT
jgi:ASC-1-like (ASCH) protein